MKRILCYGDSNTWGHIPCKGTRYEEDVRWPGVMAFSLGKDYRVIEDSISGRTTMQEDPNCPKRLGCDNLGYSLLAHAPFNLVILALGINDLRFTDPIGVSRNISRMIDLINGADALYCSFSPIFTKEKNILLITPPKIDEHISTIRPYHALANAAKASLELPPHYERIAKEKNVHLLDASALVAPTLEDCIHLSPESHCILGNAIADKVKQIFTE